MVRKKDSKEKGFYFGKEEEEAVVRFLKAETFDERNQIYNEKLRKPLDQMISSIIRRYQLYRKGMDFTDIHVDTHSFLMTKLSNFDPDRNKKAYSYFGTICKNYLLAQIQKDRKEEIRNISYEDISPIMENDHKRSYIIDDYIPDREHVLKVYRERLIEFMDTEDLVGNDARLGWGLVDLFSNYQLFIPDSKDNPKFNKNLILLILRNNTGLSTKDIRKSMKRFKDLYGETLELLLN